MKLIDTLVIAIRSLAVNKLRSSLTILGIIIGVSAVISLMSVGKGAQARITSTLEKLGTNLVYVTSQTPGVRGLAVSPFATPSLTLDDAKAIAARVPSVLAASPVTENYAEVTSGDESTLGVIEATTPEFQHISNYAVARGQFISERNVTSRDMVVVLGDKIAKDLFGSKDPLQQKVKISGRQFTIIGVLEPKGGQMMGVSLDAIVVVPITTYQARLFPRQTIRGEDAVQSIAVQAASAELIDTVSEDIKALLRKRHRIGNNDKDDFAIITQEEMLGIFQQITGVFTIVMGAIAGISLLVGGIGIMNITLVSVTERTREIGIRKAVGAKRPDILLQFLLEAVMLSLVGGGIGIVVGWVLSLLISQIATGGITLRAVVTPDIVLLAVSVSVIIGLASGIYPAMRAARLNPIDALHYG